MWQIWTNGILGLWVALIPFLALSLAVERTILIFTGIIIAILGFWAASVRPESGVSDGVTETFTPIKPVEKKDAASLPEDRGAF